MGKHVSDWLRDDCGMALVAPITVRIGRETYWGASYFEDLFEPGVTGEPIMYLLGNVPAAYKNSRRVCWQFPNDPDVWYLAAFADAAIAGAMPQFHPYGAWFQLRKWPTVLPSGEPAQTIDEFEETPYRRLKIREVTS